MTDNSFKPLKIDRAPLSVQAQQYLLDLIENRTYQPGERLPSENDLAAQLGISRPTLREALLNLEQEGVIIRRHGVGTFVAPGYDHQLESGLERLESILEVASRRGMRTKVDALDVYQESADSDLAGRLQVASGTPLTHVHRVIVVGRNPVAYMWDVSPSWVLSPTDVQETFNGSVLDLLRQKEDLEIAQAVANIVAVSADSFLSQKLQVQLQQALLLLEETLYSDKGVAVEFSRNYFVPEFFRFHVVRR